MPLSSIIFSNFSKGKISYIKIKKSETEVIINMRECPSMLIGRGHVNYSQTVRKVAIKLIGR